MSVGRMSLELDTGLELLDIKYQDGDQLLDMFPASACLTPPHCPPSAPLQTGSVTIATVAL